jgi:hypothetical protein
MNIDMYINRHLIAARCQSSSSQYDIRAALHLPSWSSGSNWRLVNWLSLARVTAFRKAAEP